MRTRTVAYAALALVVAASIAAAYMLGKREKVEEAAPSSGPSAMDALYQQQTDAALDHMAGVTPKGLAASAPAFKIVLPPHAQPKGSGSGHEAGRLWAEERGITDASDCGGNSTSFIEGCEEYVEEHCEETGDCENDQ